MKKKFIKLLKECIKQNKLLNDKKLIVQNFGNVSIRLDSNHFTIKPSGVNLNKLKYINLPIIRINNSKQIYGNLKPSSDTLTHLEIYKKFDKIKSISHTHSTYATSWAQTGKAIPLIGTTHADFWTQEIPIVRFLKNVEVKHNYEKNTGLSIVETLKKNKLNAYNCPGVLVAGHGPFAWGENYDSSVLHSEILEFVAKISFLSLQIKLKKKLPSHISKKHYERKNGKKAYYGQ